MTSESWNKILNFVKRTGDRALIVDQETEEIFVITTLNDYEQKVFSKSAVKGLTEEQMLDRINRDIAVWQAAQNSDQTEMTEFEATDIEKEENVADDVIDAASDEEYYVEPTI